MKYIKYGIFPKQFDLSKGVDKHLPLKIALAIAGAYTILGV